jgi:hypothetical protein
MGGEDSRLVNAAATSVLATLTEVPFFVHRVLTPPPTVGCLH